MVPQASNSLQRVRRVDSGALKIGELNMEVRMKISLRRVDDTIICTLPNGRELELVMISAIGEDHSIELDLQYAEQVVQRIPRRLFRSD